METRYDYGPLQTYEITWRSGHVERIQAHQVTYPQAGMVLGASGLGLLAEQRGESQIRFHGQIDGMWRLVLCTDEALIQTVRLVTADEPIPGAAS